MIPVRYPVIDQVLTGANITKCRKNKQYSIQQVASFMGSESPVAVYKWERGGALPTVDHLYALSKLLDVSMDYIIIEQMQDADINVHSG